MELSIVFPAYNEEGNIEAAVRQALAYLGSRSGEVLVVNDGSKDRTAEILNQLVKEYPGRVRAIHHPKNQGYAPTLRDGFLAAQGDWIFYTDSDNQFVLNEIDLLMNIREGADLVVGYRKDRQDPAFRKFAAGTYNAMVRLAFGLRGVRDIDCAFKLFKRNVFEKIQIESSHFLVDAEILLKAKKKGLVIREVGVTHLPRKFGESTVKPIHVANTLWGLIKTFLSTPSLLLMKIAIVGGGITGLALAYKLAQQGEKPVVFEKSARLGGLVGSFRIADVWLEKYFHHIFLSDTAVRRSIAELGMEKDLFWKVTPMGFYGNGKIHPFDGALDLLKFSVLSFPDRLRFGANVWKAGKMKGGLSLDAITAKEWVTQSWGGEIYENFWGPLLKSKFSDAADHISAAWLWGRIYARANSRSGGEEKLGYLRGGFVRILEEMGKQVESKGGEIRLHQEVKRVQKVSNHFEIQTDGDVSSFDVVVMTTPSPIIANLCPDLSPNEAATHKAISYVSILCMPIVMNRPLSHIYWMNVGDRTIPFTGVIEHTNYIPKEEYGGKEIVYLFNYLPMGHPWLSETKETVFARYEEGLKRIFPNYRRDQIEQIMIFRDTYANVIYEQNYLKKIPPIASATPGLYFANTAHIFPDDRNQNYSITLAERALAEIKKKF